MDINEVEKLFDTTKKCSKCKLRLDLNQYHADRGRLNCACKECIKKKNKIIYLKKRVTNNVYCNICDCDVIKSYLKIHNLTKKHLKNLEPKPVVKDVIDVEPQLDNKTIDLTKEKGKLILFLPLIKDIIL